MSSLTKAVPPGGPGTINGILYQLLWSLATLGGFRATDQQVNGDTLDSIRLILEPSTGGDQQVFSGENRLVAQLKARSTGQPWSLQEVIVGVLPDLYLSVDQAFPNSEYRFVTESQAGKWNNVQEFFTNLPSFPNHTDLLAQLDDTNELKFGRALRKGQQEADKKAFWDADPYSSRRLFKKIVATLRERPSIQKDSYEVTCRKTWSLLRGFRFSGGITQTAVKKAIDEFLLARIGSADRLSEKRDALLLDLAKRACSGDTLVDARSFFEEHGLDGTPLTNWFELSKQARDYFDRALLRKGVDPSEDVRPSFTRELLDKWNSQSPIVLVTGESGSGKTWHGFMALADAAQNGDIVLIVDSTGNADDDLRKAESVFWHDIAKRDEAPPLARLRRRLQQLSQIDPGKGMVLFIDNVTSNDQMRRLIESDWEAWGVRVLMTCHPNIAEEARRQIRNRGRVVRVTDFKLEELRRFLSSVLNLSIEQIPADIRDTIRRPLLARLFREVVNPGKWEARNEYELYQQSWKRLATCVQDFDLDALLAVARGLLAEKSRYPWTAGDLKDVGISSDGLTKIIANGWVSKTTNSDYEVWHDRLLNWTVAEAVADALRHDHDDSTELVTSTANLLRQPRSTSGRILSYVPMDVLWLLAEPAMSNTDLVDQIVDSFELAMEWRASAVLYKSLLPTLGKRAFEILFKRLKYAMPTGPFRHVSDIVAGLKSCDADELRKRAFHFLIDPDPKVRRVGAIVCALCPSENVLDRLWEIHKDGCRHADKYIWTNQHHSSVYADSFAALKACVPLNPTWLEREIARVDALEAPVHDLAYLVANLRDYDLWKRCKANLIAKVDESHARSIAMCILVFRDSSERQWLEHRISETKDLVGVVSLRALAAIEPERALEFLDVVDESHLYMSRDWGFLELYVRMPEEVITRFASILQRHADPWRYALVLQGREDLIDVTSFDFLLDRLSEELFSFVESNVPRNITAACRTGFRFLNAAKHPILLECLRKRRNSPLERNLARWLLAVGPHMGEYKDHDTAEATGVLARIGGEGFSQVLNQVLEQGDWFGRYEALQLTLRRCTVRTAELLTMLSKTDDEVDSQQRIVIQGYAAASLANHSVWEPVLDYYLRVGMRGITVVAESTANKRPMIDDPVLRKVLDAIRKTEEPSPGAILVVALFNLTELLPEVRAIFHSADPSSDVARACLIALKDMGDTDPATVTDIVRCLPGDKFLAINTLIRNSSDAAIEALVSHMQQTHDLELAGILFKESRSCESAIGELHAIAMASADRFRNSLSKLASGMSEEGVRDLANLPVVFEAAEKLAYAPDLPVRVHDVKPLALRILGVKYREAAFETAIARLNDPGNDDKEGYVQLCGELFPDRAPEAFLESLLLDVPAYAIHCIGCEMLNLNSWPIVQLWLSDAASQKRVAACRVAGYLTPTAALRGMLLDLCDDPDHRVAEAAVKALERIREQKIAELLVSTLKQEQEPVHKWTILDALIATANPGFDGSVVSWAQEIGDHLSPAMRRHLENRISERQKDLKDQIHR